MAERILIVDDDPDLLQLTSSLLAQAGYQTFTATMGLEALDCVDQIRPDLIILDVMMPGMDGYEVCRRLRRKPELARVPVIMLTARDTPEAKIQAFEAGADQYVNKPFHAAELRARVQGLLQRAAAVSYKAPQPTGKVIGVFSLRGGVGVSTLATNLAAALAQIWGASAILMDLVLTAGHAALMLGLSQNRTWANLAELAIEEIDAGTAGNVLLTHSSGVRVLAAPQHPAQGSLITADKVTHVINTLGDQYHYLVLDLPHDFHEIALAGLDAAQEVLLVMAPELASLLSMVAALDAFRDINYPMDKIRVVLNQTFERPAITTADIERAIKRPVDLEIPYAGHLFMPAVTRGVPPVIGAPNSEVGALLEDYAFSLSKEEHKRQHPDKPTKAWQRVAQRMQRRQSAWKAAGPSAGPAWLTKIVREIAEAA